MAEVGSQKISVPGHAGNIRSYSTVLETSTVKALEGERVNQYVIEEEIGRGAFGTVFKVVNDDTKLRFAMKEIDKDRIRRKTLPFGLRGPRGIRAPPGKGPSPNVVELAPIDIIKREVAIMKQLRHPNIIRLVEVLDSTESTSMYMILELAERGTVMNISGGYDQVPPLSLTDSKRYFRDLILGLEYLHSQEIVHRDLKPENLLLCADGRLKIADFGVSETGDQLRNTAGSPAFMAPETLGIKDSTATFSAKKADIWAGGVCLYCFVTGGVPFKAKDQLELYRVIRETTLTYPESMDALLIDLFSKLFNKDPIQRITIDDIKVASEDIEYMTGVILILDEQQKHDWVTDCGYIELPSTDDHCRVKINTSLTEEEVSASITKIASFSTMMMVYKAAKKMQSIRKRSASDHDQKSQISKNVMLNATVR